jgi:PDZ domain
MFSVRWAVVVGVGLAALCGCAPRMTAQQQAAVQAEAARPVGCFGADDCQVKWSRALLWVKNNSAYKFQQATDSLISTMGPLPDDPRPAYTITKIANGGGRFTFDFDGGCDNMFGCVPSLLEAKASFVAFVMGPAQAATAAPPSPAQGSVVLGINAVPVPPPLANTLGLGSARGIFVATVAPGSAAARAGLQPGDIILSFAGQSVNAPAELQHILVETAPGSAVSMGVWHQRAETTETVQF